MSDIEATLNERQSTHGSFTENAVIVDRLMAVISNTANWPDMSAVQREAVNMAIRKLARILIGDALLLDNWRDLVGYLQLAINDMQILEGTRDVRITKVVRTLAGWVLVDDPVKEK